MLTEARVTRCMTIRIYLMFYAKILIISILTAIFCIFAGKITITEYIAYEFLPTRFRLGAHCLCIFSG